jgi:hypothetical protein
MNEALRGFRGDPAVRVRGARAEVSVEPRVLRGEVVTRDDRTDRAGSGLPQHHLLPQPQHHLLPHPHPHPHPHPQPEPMSMDERGRPPRASRVRGAAPSPRVSRVRGSAPRIRAEGDPR